MRKAIAVCIVGLVTAVGGLAGVARAEGCGTHPNFAGGGCDDPPEFCDFYGLKYVCSAGDAPVGQPR